MVRSRLGAVAVLLVATLTVTSCTGTEPPRQPPTAAPLTASPTTNDPAPTAAQTEADIVEVDPEVLAGLADFTTPTSTSLDQHYFAVWPELANHPAFTEESQSFAQSQVTGFVEDYPATSGDQVAAPELGVGWRMIASSPTIIGIIQDVSLNAGGSASQSWRTLWYDLTTAKLVPNQDLIADQEGFQSAVKTALQGVADPGYLDATFAEDEAPLLAFTPRGELVVGFDDGQAGPMSQGRIHATLTVAATEAVLSDQGKRARQAAMKPTLITPETTIEEPATPSQEPSEPTSGQGPDETSTPSPAPSSASRPTSTRPTSTASSKATSAPTTSKPSNSAPPANRGTRPDCSTLKCVALTFDDGPASTTKTLVADLKALNAPATFYVLGQQVDTYPALTKEMVANGNELGVHTWSHPELTKKSPERINSEIARTKQIIVTTTGVTPLTYRPPYGATNTQVRSIAGKNGLAEILWTVDTNDWKDRNSGVVASRAIKQARPGSIILMHDIHKTTVAAVPDIVKGLRAQGYTLVTVSDLLGSPQPGQRYSRR